MTTREKYTAGLLLLGIILAMLPVSSLSFTGSPKKLMTSLLDEKTYFSVDEVARFMVSEDSTVRIIDLRSPEEFRQMNIPGSINIPYNEILDNDPGRLLSGDVRNIFYSNGDINSNYALAIAKGLNYKNSYVMKGGLNEWFNTIMNSSFSGDRITARENALFENRLKARKMFTEINSLPDSLKIKYMEAKRTAVMKLDGGCE